MKLDKNTRFLDLRKSRIAGIVLSVQFIAALCGPAHATREYFDEGFQWGNKRSSETVNDTSRELVRTKRQALKKLKDERGWARARLCILWAKKISEIETCFKNSQPDQ